MAFHDPARESLAALEARVRPRRLERMREVIGQRMKGLTVVLEGLYDPGNRSAVYRSAEAFGLSEVHVVRPEAASKPHARSVSRGAEKWLRIHSHDTPEDAAAVLRAQGFRILVADVGAAQPLGAVDFSRRTALVFGNEHAGISDEMREAADGAFVIPMSGFAESLNISVAAAIALSHARLERERALGARTDIDGGEAAETYERYVRLSNRWIKRIRAARSGEETDSTEDPEGQEFR